MKKLTQSMVYDALPREKDYYLFDHQIKGLGCRIYPTGIKTYYYRYSSPIDKNRKMIKIGNAIIIKLEDARNASRKYATQIYNHVDPLKSKKYEIEKQNQKKLTFNEFWDRFLIEWIHKRQKQSTIINNESKFKRICSYFKNMIIEDITFDDIINFKNTINHDSVFYICISYLRSFFKYAEICKLRSVNSNPCTHISGKTSIKREKYLNDKDLHKLVEYIYDQINNNRKIYSYYGILCILYTGQRKNEILKLQWKNINFDEKFAILNDSKTGKRNFVLNDIAISIFKQIPKIDENPYVFCGMKPNTYIKNIDDAWYILRAKFNLDDLRIHDLRHSFAKYAINNGVSLYELSKILGHSSVSTTQRYAHLSIETLLKATNQVFKTI